MVIGVERFSAKLRPCGSSVHVCTCRVLIQNSYRSGKALGSQCSCGTILWSLIRKSCDFLAKWRYRGTHLFVSEACRCMRKRTLRLLEVRPVYSFSHLLQTMRKVSAHVKVSWKVYGCVGHC